MRHTPGAASLNGPQARTFAELRVEDPRWSTGNARKAKLLSRVLGLRHPNRPDGEGLWRGKVRAANCGLFDSYIGRALVAKSPYRIARQEHVAEMLDELQDRGLIEWQWDYENSSAIYWVRTRGGDRRKLGTKQAETFVEKLCQQEGIVWLPVPPPGGEKQRDETLRRIATLRGETSAQARATAAPLRPPTAVPFDLSAYPRLRQSLHDNPSTDRSAQTYRIARDCVDLGLSDGHIKWFVAQYPPFLDKYAGRPDRARELDRVINRARKDRAK